MYSVILLAALTAGVNTPACHFGHGLCSAGYGGYGYAGCWGCYGCSCYGCYGCSGCYGFSTCWGSYGPYGCHGCYGGYGGYGCAGCYGGFASNGGMCGGWPPAYYNAPTDTRGTPSTTETGLMRTQVKKDNGNSRAKLTVEVPEDAKLYIDDQLMKTTSSRRVFNTPPLEPGQAYYYIVRVEFVRDGKTQSEEKRVIVRPGEDVVTSFAEPARPSTVTVDAGKR
jgi:uncharacterized protein (TIGR03000 family)